MTSNEQNKNNEKEQPKEKTKKVDNILDKIKMLANTEPPKKEEKEPPKEEPEKQAEFLINKEYDWWTTS